VKAKLLQQDLSLGGAHANAAQPAARPASLGLPPLTLDPGIASRALQQSLEREGQTDLLGIVSNHQGRSPVDLFPRMLRSAPDPKIPPFLLMYGPLSEQEAMKAIGPPPKGRPPAEWFEHGDELYLVYENDGDGIVPNFGAGSDQGRTAAVHVFIRKHPVRTGLTEAGVGFDMYTPRGFDPKTPSGMPPPEQARYLGTYTTAPGPYAGLVYGHVKGIVSKEGRITTEVSGAVGANVQEAGKLAQDFIHRNISNSPLFPWPRGTTPFAELGVGKTLTVQDVLGRHEFDNHLEWRGRLELGWDAVTGTRRTEATVKGTFVLESAIWHTELGDFHLEWSLGGMGRAFMRYNDGRTSTEMGVEAGFNTSVMVTRGRLGLGLQGEDLFSTDPAFRTGLPAGREPAAFAATPLSAVQTGLGPARLETGLPIRLVRHRPDHHSMVFLSLLRLVGEVRSPDETAGVSGESLATQGSALGNRTERRLRLGDVDPIRRPGPMEAGCYPGGCLNSSRLCLVRSSQSFDRAATMRSRTWPSSISSRSRCAPTRIPASVVPIVSACLDSPPLAQTTRR